MQLNLETQTQQYRSRAYCAEKVSRAMATTIETKHEFI